MKSKHIGFIDLEIYPARILLAVGVGGPQIQKFLERKTGYKFKGEEAEEWQQDLFVSAGRSAEFENRATLLWLEAAPKDPYRMGVLAHEALHNASLILRRLNIKMKGKYDETYPYVVGYIVQKALEQLK